MRKRLMTIGVLTLGTVLVVALVSLGVRVWQDRSRTDLERAIAMAPADTARYSWTDWSGVRDELGVDLDADSPTAAVEDLLDQGFSADLTSTSGLLGSATTLHERFGFSPASLDWELFSQSESGASFLLGLTEETDYDDLTDTLREIGYTQDDDGTWTIDIDALTQLGEVTSELSFVALDEDDRLLLASDTTEGLAAARDGVAEGGPTEGVDQVVEAAPSTLTAAIYTGDYACGALAMSQADPGDQTSAERLVEEAGGVNPFTGFAIGLAADGTVRVTLAFENDDQARDNADSRAVLASGPAPGQGGDFNDRFEVEQVSAEGQVVTLELAPVENSFVVSDLSTGPVLFATC